MRFFQRCEADLLGGSVRATGLGLYYVEVWPDDRDGWTTWRFARSAEKAGLAAAGLRRSWA